MSDRWTWDRDGSYYAIFRQDSGETLVTDIETTYTTDLDVICNALNRLEAENARLRSKVERGDALLRNAVNLYDAVFDYSAYRCDWDTVLEAWESFDDDDATLDAYRAANTEGE